MKNKELELLTPPNNIKGLLRLFIIGHITCISLLLSAFKNIYKCINIPKILIILSVFIFASITLAEYTPFIIEKLVSNLEKFNYKTIEYQKFNFSFSLLFFFLITSSLLILLSLKYDFGTKESKFYRFEILFSILIFLTALLAKYHAPYFIIY